LKFWTDRFNMIVLNRPFHILEDDGLSPAPAALEDLRRIGVEGCEARYARLGTGTPVVLLHTLRTQLDYFRPLLTHLDTSRMEVVAIDLPGHGESTAPRVDYAAAFFTDTTERLLDALDLSGAVIVGESIGGAIALGIAARQNPRVSQVVALNPYDYARWGGIRRSSPLANVLFTAMLWPAVGPMVAHAETKPVLRRVLRGGLQDPAALPGWLVDELSRCGKLPGHARAFRSLTMHWRSWIDARDQYPAISVPVTLVYADNDWSRPAEREANARLIPTAATATVTNAGHFSCLERPDEVAELITQVL
jgi:pimeloyl-ACP methyl ester carboxylesterase